MRRSRICSFQLDAEGIVRAQVDAGAHMDEDDAREAIAVTWALAGGIPRPVLVDLRGIHSQSLGARRILAGDEAAGRCVAVGLWVSSPLSTVIANFFFRLNEHRTPTRLFTRESAAIGWLRQYLPRDLETA